MIVCCFVRSLIVAFLVTFYLTNSLFGQGRLPISETTIKSGEKSWGDTIGFFGSVEAKSRGKLSGKATKDVTYQCVDLVKRVYNTYYDGKVENEVSNTRWGSAQEFWNRDKFNTMDKHKIEGKKTKELPKVGDIIFFGRGKYGHVAVVGNSVINKEGSGFVEIIQQNVARNSAYDVIEIKDNKVTDSYGSMEVLGWLSPKAGYSAAKPLPEFVGVNKIYQGVLGRNADVEGIKHYIGRLKTGDTPDEVKHSMLSSFEYNQKRTATIEKLKSEVAKVKSEAERIASLKEQFKETVKGILKAFDDLEHGRLEGTLPQTLYDVSTSFLQILAETQGYSVFRQRDLEQWQEMRDSTSAAGMQSNINVPERTLASPNFSDNFSAGLGNWSHSNAYTGSNFGPLISPDGSVFGIIHTGLGDSANTGLLSKQFNLSVPLNLNIGFQYNFVTNEYPDFVGSIYNDSFTAELHTPDGSTINLAGETVNSSSFTSVSGLPTDVLNFSTGGETGWKTISTTVSTPTGTSELHFHVKDVGDNVYDSATLIDNVSVK